MFSSKLASKLVTPFPSDIPGTICPLPNSSSFVFSLELSPWSAEGRRDPTSEQVDVIVQINQDEDEDGDDFDDTLPTRSVTGKG